MKRAGIAILFGVAGAIGTGIVVGAKEKKATLQQKQRADRYLTIINTFNDWFITKQAEMTVEQYFTNNGIKRIAIYGMGLLGERLMDELYDSEVEVVYAIDKNAATLCSKVDIVTPDDILEEVDAVVVTAVHFFDEIKKTLAGKLNCPIISLDEVLEEI